MKYFVEDIRSLGNEAVEVDAASPLAAARKVFPNAKITRDLSNAGDIVVGRYTTQYYGRGYRTYVYKMEENR